VFRVQHSEFDARALHNQLGLFAAQFELHAIAFRRIGWLTIVQAAK
jgi:hypothetical protein